MEGKEELIKKLNKKYKLDLEAEELVYEFEKSKIYNTTDYRVLINRNKIKEYVLDKYEKLKDIVFYEDTGIKSSVNWDLGVAFKPEYKEDLTQEEREQLHEEIFRLVKSIINTIKQQVSKELKRWEIWTSKRRKK